MKRKTPRHDTARDVCDARYADNSADITFVEELRKSLDETGRLDRRLMKVELVKVNARKANSSAPEREARILAKQVERGR